jgi:hypothetical protein
MRSTTPSNVLIALVCATIFIVDDRALAQTAPVPALSVDMPPGGCRLTAWLDGEASISYGAMPRWVRVARGTFDFEQLVHDLRDKSYTQSASKLTHNPGGTLSLPGSEDLLFLDDSELVRSLLQGAWRARVPPTTPQELKDYNWVLMACSLQ